MQLFISRKVTLYCHICLVFPQEGSFFTDTSVVVTPQERSVFVASAVWLFPKKGQSCSLILRGFSPRKIVPYSHIDMCKRFLKKENLTACKISGGRGSIVGPCDFVRACVCVCVCCIWPKDTTAVTMPLFFF